MKMKCPYCKRPLQIPYEKIKQRVLDENPPSYGPWIAAIVAGIGIAGALGLVGGTILTRSREQKAQILMPQLQERVQRLTRDLQAVTAELNEEKEKRAATAKLKEEIEKQAKKLQAVINERQEEAKRSPVRSQPDNAIGQHLRTDLQAKSEALREQDLRTKQELGDTRKPPLTRQQKPATTQEPTDGWPFEAGIPNGFAFEGTQTWENRKLWILKGKRFGNAYETIIVVETDLGKIQFDTYRAAYWAAEICLGRPLGTCTLKTSGESFVMTYTEHGDQVINCPSHPEHAYDMGLSLPLESFGRSDSYVSGGLGACSGRLDGTRFVVGWAGNYGKLLDTRKMVAAFCYDIRRKLPTESRTGSRSRTTFPAERNRSIETPLGTIDVSKVTVAFPKRGESIKLYKYQLRGNHVLVIVPVTTKATTERVHISDWCLVSVNGGKCPFIGIRQSDGQTSTGIESISLGGSPGSPQTSELLFDVPMDAGPLDLYIGARNLGQVFSKEISQPRSTSRSSRRAR